MFMQEWQKFIVLNFNFAMQIFVYLNLLCLTVLGSFYFEEDMSAVNEYDTIILWWTPFTSINGIMSRKCFSGTCLFSENRELIHHVNTKAILFYGSDFRIDDLPLPRNNNVWWALLHEESPKNQPLFDHDLTLRLFNFTSTFRRESDLPLTLQYLNSLDDLLTLQWFVSTHSKNSFLGTLSPLVYIQSDCDTPSNRDAFVEELSNFINIDSYGMCLHNRDLPPHLQNRVETMNHDDLKSLLAKYKFVLSIENAACNDYITEKFWRSLIVGSVPVYWGSPRIKDFSPNPNSFVNIRQFYSPALLASFLLQINSNDTLYETFLEHKLDQKISNALLKEMIDTRSWAVNDFDKPNFIEEFECMVCNRILDYRNKNSSYQVVANEHHYGCPEPPQVSAGTYGANDIWVEQWHRAKLESEVLYEAAVRNISIDLNEFFEDVFRRVRDDKFFSKYGRDEL